MQDSRLHSFFVGESGSGRPFFNPLFYAVISPDLNQEENDSLISLVKASLKRQTIYEDRGNPKLPKLCTGFTVTGLNNDETRQFVKEILSKNCGISEIKPFRVI